MPNILFGTKMTAGLQPNILFGIKMRQVCSQIFYLVSNDGRFAAKYFIWYQMTAGL
jgi:hypothetical protein